MAQPQPSLVFGRVEGIILKKTTITQVSNEMPRSSGVKKNKIYGNCKSD